MRDGCKVADSPVCRPVRSGWRVSGPLGNNAPLRTSRELAAVGFATVLLGLLGYVWFASTSLPLGGPNVAIATLTVLLAAASLAHVAWSSTAMAVIRQRVGGILPVMVVATLVPLWASAVYLATDTLDVQRVAKMVLGIGILFAVFVFVDTMPRARAMAFVLILAVFVSALFGFGVALVGDPFKSLWLRIANVPQEDLHEMLLFGRISGLAAHISTFGRQLAVAVPLALAALLFCDGVARPRLRWIVMVALFVLLMTLVTAMLMNATRSVVYSVCVVSAAIVVVAVRSSRARRRLLLFAPPAALWLFLYSTAGADTTNDEPSHGVVQGDMQDLAIGDDALQQGDADVVGHAFVGNEPGVKYVVQLRERYLAGYGQPGVVTVRADEQGTFVFTWRERPGVALYQRRMRAEEQANWSEWVGFERSLGPGALQRSARATLQNVTAGDAWPADTNDRQQIGYRVAGLEPGARYTVALWAEISSGRIDAVELPVTAGDDGAFVMTWAVPRDFAVLGYVYRLKARGGSWGQWHEFEAYMKVIAPRAAALRNLAVGGESLRSSAEHTRIGHTFNGFVSWLWYVVQIRQTDAKGFVKSGEVTVKPDEGGNFVATWSAPPAESEIVSYEFRARNVAKQEWSPWRHFAPSLTSELSTLYPVPIDDQFDAVWAQEGGKTLRRHTLTGLSMGLNYRAQLRVSGDHGHGPESHTITMSPDHLGNSIFAWRESAAVVPISGYQFRLWWYAKDRWWPWQDFVPNVDGTGRTKAEFTGRLDTQKQNVTAAQTIELLDFTTQRTTWLRGLMDSTAQTRLHELTTVLRYFRDHPFGTGIYEPQISHISHGLENWLVEDLLRLWPHNQFLHVLVLFGWLGAVLLVAFYLCVLRPVARCIVFAWRASDSDMRFLALGVVGAWMAYSANTLLIPTGPFLGGWSHFYLIGLLFCVERIVQRAGSGRSPDTVLKQSPAA